MFSLETIGGRKFIGFIALIIAGITIEVAGKSGLSTTMASFLVGLYAAFSATNAAITLKGLTAGEAAQPEQAQPAAAPANEELTQQIANVLSQIGTALQTLQAGQARNEQALNVLQQSTSTLQKAVGTILVDKQG